MGGEGLEKSYFGKLKKILCGKKVYVVEKGEMGFEGELVKGMGDNEKKDKGWKGEWGKK